MIRYGYKRCSICKYVVKEADCKRIRLIAINAVEQEGEDSSKEMAFYACKTCFPILKAAIQDALLKVREAVADEQYWKYARTDEEDMV